MLSGFVLSYGFFLNRSNKLLINQSLKRYIRLAIPVFLSVMVGYLFLNLGLFRNQEVAKITGSIHFAPLWNFAPNFGRAVYTGILGVFTNGSVEYNPVLWTMQIELIGSFLVFLFLALFGKYKYRWFFYLFVLIFVWNQFLSPFIIGIIICDLYTSSFGERLMQLISKPSTITFLILTVIIGGSVPAFSGDIVNLKYTQIFSPYISAELSPLVWHNLAAVAVLLLALGCKSAQSILGSKPLVYIGKISFALYLLHYFVYATVTSYVFIQIYDKIPYWIVTIICFLVSIPLIILFSAFWTKYVDQKAIFASRLFAKRFSSQ